MNEGILLCCEALIRYWLDLLLNKRFALLDGFANPLEQGSKYWSDFSVAETLHISTEVL